MSQKNIGEKLLRYHWKKHDYVIADLESENLCLIDLNKPWEVGYIVVEKGQIKEEQNRRIWWNDLNISEDAARITRFDYSDYENTAEDAKLVLEEFESYLYDSKTINITYNGLNFDVYLHNLWREKLGLPKDWSYLARSLDVLALSRAYKLGLEPPETHEDFIFWQYKLINYMSDERLRKGRKKELGSCTLKSMCKEFDIEFDDSKGHEGLYDVGRTWEVFKQLIWKMDLTIEHLGL